MSFSEALPGSARSEGRADHRAAESHGQQTQGDAGLHFLSGMGVPWGTATAVTLFWGEPSMTRSE